METPKKVKFPTNITLEEVREAIKDRSDFRECIFDDHIIFVYFLGMKKDIFQDPNSAPDEKTKKFYELRRECRGLVFSKQTRKVISRRFHKFFNVNETPETKVENLEFSKDFIILEKVDGSMIAPYFINGVLRFASKNGITDTALDSEYFVSKILEEKQIDYKKFSIFWIEKGYTPIYEFCSTVSPIVLKYKEDSMNLIAIRNISTGNYLSFSEMVESAKKFNIPTIKTAEQIGIKLPNFTDINTFSQFYKAIQSTEGVEGFVIRFSDDRMLKIKTTWYFGINHALDALKRNQNERKKWEAILNESYDDLKPFLGDEDRQAMDKFAEDLVKEIDQNSWKLVDKIMETGHFSRKEFSNVVSKAHHSWKKPLWFLWRYLNENNEDNNINNNQKNNNNKNNNTLNNNNQKNNNNLNNKNNNLNDDDKRKKLFPITQKQVIIQILSSLNSKKDFEIVQNGLASGITWEKYKPLNKKKIDD